MHVAVGVAFLAGKEKIQALKQEAKGDEANVLVNLARGHLQRDMYGFVVGSMLDGDAWPLPTGFPRMQTDARLSHGAGNNLDSMLVYDVVVNFVRKHEERLGRGSSVQIDGTLRTNGLALSPKLSYGNIPIVEDRR